MKISGPAISALCDTADRADFDIPMHVALDLALALTGVLPKEGLVVGPTIRVIQKGDFDDQMVINIIGPFPTESARDAELQRLKGLPLMHESAELSASLIPAVAAEHAITAEASAAVAAAGELFEELFYT